MKFQIRNVICLVLLLRVCPSQWRKNEDTQKHWWKKATKSAESIFYCQKKFRPAQGFQIFHDNSNETAFSAGYLTTIQLLWFMNYNCLKDDDAMRSWRFSRGKLFSICLYLFYFSANLQEKAALLLKINIQTKKKSNLRERNFSHVLDSPTTGTKHY